MAHPNPNLAAIQTKLNAGVKTVSLHPADTAALISQGIAISDPSVSRKITYANQNGISINLSDSEMAQLLTDINVKGK